MFIFAKDVRRLTGIASLVLGCVVIATSVGVSSADAQVVKVRVQNEEEGPRERNESPPPPPPSASPASGGSAAARTAAPRPLTPEQQREAAENAKKHFERARQTLADEGELDEVGNKIGPADAVTTTKTTDVASGAAAASAKGLACVAGC